MTTMRRILGLAHDLDYALSESDWIESATENGLSFIEAVIDIQAMVDDGTLVVVRKEPVP